MSEIKFGYVIKYYAFRILPDGRIEPCEDFSNYGYSSIEEMLKIAKDRCVEPYIIQKIDYVEV